MLHLDAVYCRQQYRSWDSDGVSLVIMGSLPSKAFFGHVPVSYFGCSVSPDVQ